ncbi:MAG TPA: hypothetical protein VJ571_07265 [Candidatus Nitrosotalea sp.]|nr:hypothetical protein [Candidatus Nitrosotalea sp.]
MNKTMPIIAVVITMTLFSTSIAYATSHNVSIFSDALKYADSNSYKNSNYSISIQPPINWTVLTNLPPDVSNQSIAVFSNNDKTQLATFGIYHRDIASNVIDAINSHSDNDVLATIAQEMTHQDIDSKTIVYNGVVDRYTDGVRITVSSATHYTADNSTSLSENIIYFLDNGNQYTLDLTSNSDNIDKNSQLFEDSANTFVASQTNPVPEFPISLAILITGMFSAIFVFRIRGTIGTTGHT